MHPDTYPYTYLPPSHIRITHAFTISVTAIFIGQSIPCCAEIVHKDLSIWNLHLMFTILLNSSFIPVPETFPGNFSGSNISQTAIQLCWGPVPQDKANGIVIGYNVSLKEIDGAQPTRYITFDSSNLPAVIGWLKPFTGYKVNVRAFTTKGSGPPSPFITVKTEQEGG